MRFARGSSVFPGGVAFLSPNRTEGLRQDRQTKCAAYLIKISQFWDIVAQENNLAETETHPLPDIIEAGSILLNNKGDDHNNYDTVVHVGNYCGLPMLTVTCGETDSMPPVKPYETYLRLISGGLQTVHELDAHQVAEYLAPMPGVEINYSFQDLDYILSDTWPM